MTEEPQRCDEGPAVLWLIVYGLGLGVACVGGVLGLMWVLLS